MQTLKTINDRLDGEVTRLREELQKREAEAFKQHFLYLMWYRENKELKTDLQRLKKEMSLEAIRGNEESDSDDERMFGNIDCCICADNPLEVSSKLEPITYKQWLLNALNSR